MAMATPPPSPLPWTYQEKWKDVTSPLSVQDFYTTFPTDGTTPPKDMLSSYLQNDNDAYLVGLWCLIETPLKQPRVLTLHGLKRAPVIIGKSSHLAGKVLGVQNDIHATGNLLMCQVTIEEAMFDTVNKALVPKTNAVEVVFANKKNAGNNMLKPVTASADTEEVVTYHACPIPLEIL